MSRQCLSKNKKRKETRKQDKLVNAFLSLSLANLGLPSSIISASLNPSFSQSVCNDYAQLLNKNTEASIEDFNTWVEQSIQEWQSLGKLSNDYDLSELEEGDTILDYLQTEVFKFCGCGSAFNNMKYIYLGLLFIEFRAQRILSLNLDNLLLKVFGSEAASRFFYYWASKEDLTEHGGCIPGWLTKKGKRLILDLYSFYKENNNE